MNKGLLSRLRAAVAGCTPGCCALLALAILSGPAWAATGLDFPVASRDAVVISDPDGAILFSANADTPLVPASILKLLTALVALDTLGPDYRFATDVGITADRRLRIKGYGDPLFISEVMRQAAAQIAVRITSPGHTCLSGILLDNRYFAEPLVIPGVSDSDNPYDAPNGALCANFNTVFFTRNARSGRIESAEPQTPLLRFAEERIGRRTGAVERVVLSHGQDDATLYVGHLLRYFLESYGCCVSGEIALDWQPPLPANGSWRFLSPYPLTEVIQRMMTHSNNFMANQLLIAAAAAAYGPPGSLDKAARLSSAFAAGKLGLGQVILVEGSGISRGNRISAADMHRVLRAFYPHRGLLRRQGEDVFKTGTLDGIRTRAGYLTVAGRDYGYVIMLNCSAHRMDAVRQAVARRIAAEAKNAGGGR